MLRRPADDRPADSVLVQLVVSPLHRAAEKGNAACVTVLLEAGADKDARNKARRAHLQ